jgi:hypothetical protein
MHLYNHVIATLLKLRTYNKAVEINSIENYNTIHAGLSGTTGIKRLPDTAIFKILEHYT